MPVGAILARGFTSWPGPWRREPPEPPLFRTLFEPSLRLVADRADRDLLALAGAGVGPGALSSDGQSLAMADAAIAIDRLKTPDVLREHSPEVALYDEVVLEKVRDRGYVFVGQLVRLETGLDIGLLDDLRGDLGSDAIDIAQRVFDTLVAGMSTPMILGIVHSLRCSQPCFCLWRGLREQVTRTVPLRLMIWQYSHLRLMEALTSLHSPKSVEFLFLA
jgi:hypothetical protein